MERGWGSLMSHRFWVILCPARTTSSSKDPVGRETRRLRQKWHQQRLLKSIPSTKSHRSRHLNNATGRDPSNLATRQSGDTASTLSTNIAFSESWMFTCYPLSLFSTFFHSWIVRILGMRVLQAWLQIYISLVCSTISPQPSFSCFIARQKFPVIFSSSCCVHRDGFPRLWFRGELS